MSALAPLPGFATPVRDAHRVFRAVMSAMAEPGRVITIAGLPAAPAPFEPTAAAVLLALADYETPVWLSPSLRAGPPADFLRFHTGAPVVADATRAVFAVFAGAGDFRGFEGLPIGSLDYPDRSATAILCVDRLAESDGLRLVGPGVPGERRLAVDPLPDALVPALAANRSLFPRGVDLILAAPGAVAALPRSTTVSA